MNTYTMHTNLPGSDRRLNGESMDQAIINNLGTIIADSSSGRLGRDSVETVTAKYMPGILGGLGGIEVTTVFKHADFRGNKTETHWIYSSDTQYPEKVLIDNRKKDAALREQDSIQNGAAE